MKISDFILFSLLMIIFFFGIYFFWSYFPMGNESFGEYKGNISSIQEISGQFYPNMRFRDRKISYEIEPACGDVKKRDIYKAVDIIEQRTILSFYETENGEIMFLCSEVAPEPEQKNHFVAGEGGPTEIINSSKYSVILKAKVSLFRSGSCDEPKIAIHEIFHALGFDHNSNKKSIMYPVTDCSQEIDDYLIEDINKIYEEDSLPDLVIENINANKSGRYVNFEITVSNIGLKDSLSSELIVFGDGNKIKSFDFGKIEIGTKKFLNVQNLRATREVDRISFVVNQTINEGEIDLNNNKVDLYVDE